MPRSSREAPTPEQFLSGFPPEIAALSNHLRGLIRRAVPDPIEAVYPGWKLIGYRVRDGARDRYFGYIAVMLPAISSSGNVRIVRFLLGRNPGTLELQRCLIAQSAMRALLIVVVAEGRKPHAGLAR